MDNKLKIYNGFGITPTSTYTAAGLDFYVPVICNDDQYTKAIASFKESFNVNDDLMAYYINSIKSAIQNISDYQILNIIHLYLALDAKSIRTISPQIGIFVFMERYLIYDAEHDVYGVKLKLNDHYKFNSGIKVGLDPDTAGLFVNKSGKGTKGFDVRACLVDEDYSGYVHLSGAYTKDNGDDGVIYCGDKITQMMILPIIHKEPEEISEEEYNKLMENSERGSKAMGSSDVKH